MTIRKDFYLTPEWTEDTADRLDGFCQRVVDDQNEIRSGSYTGTGHAHTVLFEQTIGSPAILWLEDSTGAVVTVMSPQPAGHVTAWTKSNFTLRDASTYNQVGQTYRFFLVSS